MPVLWIGVGLVGRLNAHLRALGFGRLVAFGPTYDRWLVRVFRAFVIAIAAYATVALVWG